MIENTFLNDRLIVEPTETNYFIGKSLSSRAHNFSLLKKFNQRDINQRLEFHLNRPKSDQHKSNGSGIPQNLKDYVLYLGQVFTDASLIFNQ